MYGHRFSFMKQKGDNTYEYMYLTFLTKNWYRTLDPAIYDQFSKNTTIEIED